MHAYYGLGTAFLVTLAVGAVLVLAYGLVSNREPYDGYLALGVLFIPPAAATTATYPSALQIAYGLKWKPFAGALISALIGLCMFALEFLWGEFIPFYSDRGREGEILFVVKFLLGGLAVFPIVRFLVSLAIRKMGVKTGLQPLSKKRMLARIEELGDRDRLLSLATETATVPAEDRIIRLSL